MPSGGKRWSLGLRHYRLREHRGARDFLPADDALQVLMLERKQREQRDAEHGDRDQHFEQREAGPWGKRALARLRREAGEGHGESFGPAAHCVIASAAAGGTSPLVIPTLPVSGLKFNVRTSPETLIRWITVAST